MHKYLFAQRKDSHFSFHDIVRRKNNGGNVSSVDNISSLAPSDYSEQSCTSLPAYIEKNAPLVMTVLEASSASDLSAIEMGDGNLNLVFIVTNNANGKKIIVKQVSYNFTSTFQLIRSVLKLSYYRLCLMYDVSESRGRSRLIEQILNIRHCRFDSRCVQN